MAANDTKLTEAVDALTDQIKVGNKHLRKQTSLKQALVHSVVQGAGYAIGAGLVASILIALLTKIVSSLPWVQGMLPQ